MDTKICTGPCGFEKFLSEFALDSRYNDGRRITRCRDCKSAQVSASQRKAYPKKKIAENARSKEYFEQNPTYAREWWLKKKYGITIEGYETLLSEQGGVCAVCGNEPIPENTQRRGVLFVDHDHVTGEIRGLLCAECNKMLGHGKDDPDRLISGAMYLLKTNTLIEVTT